MIDDSRRYRKPRGQISPWSAGPVTRTVADVPVTAAESAAPAPNSEIEFRAGCLPQSFVGAQTEEAWLSWLKK